MAFAQLTYRKSLRDSEVCLRAQQSKLYHLGIRSSVARNTLANELKHRELQLQQLKWKAAKLGYKLTPSPAPG